MLYIIFAAIGLLFVFEGILPFVSPNFWRQMVLTLSVQPDAVLRRMGFILMMMGAAIITLAHFFLL